MKKKLGSTLTYIGTIILLTLTMFDPEESIMRDVYMAALTGLIYIVFTIGWGKLVQQTKFEALHKWLFVLITWYALLTIGDILIFQETQNALVLLGMLLFLLICLYVYRSNRMVVDAYTAAVLFVTLYIAMQMEHTIIPGGVIGGIVISIPFLILAAKKSLRATQIVGRLVFFLMAFTILLLAPATPIIAEGGYLLYLVLMIFIVAFVYRRKIELLLPQQAMPVLLVVALIMYVVKFF
ncbi:hypothetical protein JOD29_003072 [Lysinibacillus composti]|uniref:Uncharacterized protein n=1 Tax=Lysinibacillus composti TaxID=720633 RepID=A0A3N9UAQ4_9BACI|nr:hypothetical protein [Lysinibacillus composti]MBM7609796.1 hypothetical protein [Lysinibacillus composti]RQW73570.1 hypothetical protein EBB45_15805 [Lysinibacillus composti]